MTLSEAIAQQPAWVGIWLNVMMVGAMLLPFSLLIWRASRLTAVVTFVANVGAVLSTGWLYSQLGYVKLLGLGHMVFWTPLIVLIVVQMRREDMPVWPRRIMAVVMVTMLISLVLDYIDVGRYLLGERTATIPAPSS
ncbi:hypothetical protein N9L47_04090 [Rhodobacteraceae bacterium]|nr:hypothetical protein [Paracoccaceae bacterium]